MKYTTEEYINSLKKDKEDLINILKNKNIKLENKETFTSLNSKIELLPSEEEALLKIIDNSIPLTSSSTSCGSWALRVKKLPAFSFSGNSAYSLFMTYRGEELDLSLIDVSNVTSMQTMFFSCSNLKNLNMEHFNTSKNTNLQQTFYGCSSLLSLNVNNFDVSKVQSFWGTFTGCSNLTELDLSNWTGTATTMTRNMFQSCSSLKRIDLRNFTSSAKNTTSREMFSECSSLEYIDMRSFDFSSITTYTDMFKNVPTNCLIIVKDETAKNWVKSRASSFTNIKTIEEYEEA